MPRPSHVLAASAAVVILAACASAKVPVDAGTQNAVPSAAQAAIASAIAVDNAPWIGSVKSRKFYPASCHTVKLIKPADKVGFASVADAEKAGFAKDLYSTDCRY